MKTEKILLPRNLVQQMFHQAQASPDSEVCGLISAANGEVRHCYPVANVAGEPAHLFDMDPQGQVRALREIRERGETLFAIYHSHPHGPAQPSRHDIQRSHYPDVAQLIVSLADPDRPQVRAFRIIGAEVLEIEVHAIV